MKGRYDVVSIGECLLDVVAQVDGGALRMEGRPGGAPLNVAAANAKLGAKAAFIGKLATDAAGRFLLDAIRCAGVSDEGVVLDDTCPSTMAMVSLGAAGERSFSFYRSGTSDVLLREAEVCAALLQNTRILHFGSVSLTAEPARSATLSAVSAARSGGALISYDPNLRETLWPDLAEAKKWIRIGLELAHLVKLSEEELFFLTGTNDAARGAQTVFAEFSALKLLLVTRGADGACAFTRSCGVSAMGIPVTAVDTTGAGDAFLGAFLYRLLERDLSLDSVSVEALTDLLAYANAAGALSVTRPGAIPSLPDAAEIRGLLRG